MANRSYLYSTNFIPRSKVEPDVPKVIGISEWAYDIPLVYKLLLSGNPRECKSSIWKGNAKALIGDYEQGVEALKAFLQQIAIPDAQPLIREAITFLEKKENRQPYFLLEGSEIFGMSEESLSIQNKQLYNDIQNLDVEMENTISHLHPKPLAKQKPPGFFAKFFCLPSAQPKEPPPSPLEVLQTLGLGNWSNHLYFEFKNS